MPWIDLKNPALGSLGRPDLLTARKVAAELTQKNDAPTAQFSVALGELRTLNVAAAVELMRLFPITKIGLAGLGTLGRITPALQQQLDSLQSDNASPGQLVLAIYADYQRAGAPTPSDIVELARQLGSRYVLVDTFIKDGLGLFHWLTVDQLRELRAQVQAFGATLVVAGGLQSTDWPVLDQLGSAIVAVRGGVCAINQDRTSRLSTEQLHQWLQWTDQSPSL